jgi:hypothetical protein
MKKLALLLFGMSYKKYKHWELNDVIIDFRFSIENYKKYIYAYFNKLGYSIDVYLVTNEIDDINVLADLLITYKPIKCDFLPDTQHIVLSRNTKFIKVLELCISSGISYDHCLVTRFDLEFKINFNLCNFQMNNMNITSILEIPTGICDNFYLFPYKYLHQFYNVALQYKYKYFHTIEPGIRSFCNIFFFKNEHVIIKELSFYKIVRNMCSIIST